MHTLFIFRSLLAIFFAIFQEEQKNLQQSFFGNFCANLLNLPEKVVNIDQKNESHLDFLGQVSPMLPWYNKDLKKICSCPFCMKNRALKIFS